MNHYYQGIQGWMDFENIYTEQVNNAQPGAHFVEVGCWKGRSAAYMAVEIARSGKQIQFDAIDIWTGAGSGYAHDTAVQSQTLYEEFLNNIEPVKDFVKPIREWSAPAAALYADASLDFVFIDAGHDYDNITKDIRAWLPKVRPGGLLAGHDFFASADINRAVPELLSVFTVNGTSWLYQIPTP